MDRESKATLGYRILAGGWVLSLLISMMLGNFAVVGLASVLFGLWEIYFRRELGAYYASAPRVLIDQRASLRHPLGHLIGGIGFLIIGLVMVLGSVLKGM